MNNLNLKKYRTLVFDCDGVILDSNKIKTDGFYYAALPEGKDLAEALVVYHIKNGGISRYCKFEYFLAQIKGMKFWEKSFLNNLLAFYGEYVSQALLKCPIAKNLPLLREKTSEIRWMMVSGSDQTELRHIMEKRQISSLFDAGIFGSPDTKDDILSRELGQNLVLPGLFFGDSQYDLEAAKRSGLDFVFVKNWSESDYHFGEADAVIDSLDGFYELLAKGPS